MKRRSRDSWAHDGANTVHKVGRRDGRVTGFRRRTRNHPRRCLSALDDLKSPFRDLEGSDSLSSLHIIVWLVCSRSRHILTFSVQQCWLFRTDCHSSAILSDHSRTMGRTYSDREGTIPCPDKSSTFCSDRDLCTKQSSRNRHTNCRPKSQ